ncbi:MAG: PAS domain-containing protein [Pseudomonadota bacterium]|nr:PAS domain-containing protein [Pseudomonadota bacterium]
MSEHLEKRLHQRLQSYWHSLRGERPFPAEGDINLADIADILPSCFMVSVSDVGQHGYRYDYLGKDLMEAYGEEMFNPDIAGRLISPTDHGPMLEGFRQVIDRKQPVIYEAEFINRNQLTIKYRACLLPLGQEEKVSHILGCMRWGVY